MQDLGISTFLSVTQNPWKIFMKITAAGHHGAERQRNNYKHAWKVADKSDITTGKQKT